MKKKMSTRIILIVFGSIPLGARRTLFKGIALLIYHTSLKHRIITLHNLIRSFPEKAISAIQRIAKGSFRNLGIMAAEFFEAFGFTRAGVEVGAEILSRAALEDEFETASGKYFDNDIGRFAPPHPDGLDDGKIGEVVRVMGKILAGE